MVLGRRRYSRYDQSRLRRHRCCAPNSETRIAVIEKVLPAIGLLVCGVLLVRMTLSPRRRQAFDAAMRNHWYRIKRFSQRAVNWRPSSRKQAARVAEEAIERARRQRDTEREGNVYRPKSFKGPRKPH